jgi:hypothetical protein
MSDNLYWRLQKELQLQICSDERRFNQRKESELTCLPAFSDRLLSA